MAALCNEFGSELPFMSRGPVSAAPTGSEYAVQLSCRWRTFHRTANSILTVCVRQRSRCIFTERRLSSKMFTDTLESEWEEPGDVPITYADISKVDKLPGYDPGTPCAGRHARVRRVAPHPAGGERLDWRRD